MNRKFRFLLIFVLVFVVTAAGWISWKVYSQGMPDSFWNTYSVAKVTFDRHGIPTIEAENWEKAFEAQGMVMASERLFQMDVIRRKAAGRLAQLFGARAFEHDRALQSEDRLGVVRRAVSKISPLERMLCERYSRGVNQFIETRKGHWGIEYSILGTEPEPWKCEDSYQILMEMADFLTTSMDVEIVHAAWARKLPASWDNFLFPFEHPWNEPLFSSPKLHQSLHFPGSKDFLPVKKLVAGEGTQASISDQPVPIGSNNWAYRGKKGFFLANDPHMGFSVPQIWYAIRFKLTKDSPKWVVGSSLSGMPGVILGMNPHIAWAFTNTCDDVDDLIKEKINADHSKYLASVKNGQEIWLPIEKREVLIEVRGEKTPRKITAEFTHRGPLAKRELLGDDYYSREWLPYKEGMLGLPVLDMVRATSLDELDRSLDKLAVPSQNVVAMDRHGNMSYRASGLTIKRVASGDLPNDFRGEWAGYEPPSARKRLRISSQIPADKAVIATANERIWVDDLRHAFFSDDRKRRIAEVLNSSDQLSQTDMEKLQLDTSSKFRKLILQWVAERITLDDPKVKSQADRWKAWDGDSKTDPIIFTQSSEAEKFLKDLLLARVRQKFGITDPKLRYRWHMGRSWLVMVLEAPGEKGVEPFGVTSGDLANAMARHLTEREFVPHQRQNHWIAQHPLVGAPLIGRIFRVSEPPQWGDFDVVDAELPAYGPTLRYVWNLSEPEKSSWIFPVGQSGHIGSRHYHDLQALWHAGKRLPVFEKESGIVP